MQSGKQYKQPSITSYLNKQSHQQKLTNMHRKYDPKNNMNNSFLFPFSYKSPSPSMSLSQTQPTQIQTKQFKQYHNGNKSLSPSPTTMLENLDLTKENMSLKYIQNNDTNSHNCKQLNSKKRKLDGDQDNNALNRKTNCLKKVTLSDGSVCYTMSSIPSSTLFQPPTKKMRSNSYAPSKSLKTLSQPPTKKRRTNSCFISNKKKEETVQINISKNPNIGNTKKPKLVYSNTMPFPIKQNNKNIQNNNGNNNNNNNNNKKRRRRHTEDWTSKANLLASLKEQENIEDKLFPSNHIPSVNLEEIFNGQQFIRVHKKIRPINLRRETQIFKNKRRCIDL